MLAVILVPILAFHCKFLRSCGPLHTHRTATELMKLERMFGSTFWYILDTEFHILQVELKGMLCSCENT